VEAEGCVVHCLHQKSFVEKTKNNKKNMPSVKFVFIPAHPSDPMEQWEVPYTDENEVECLLDKVKVCHARK